MELTSGGSVLPWPHQVDPHKFCSECVGPEQIDNIIRKPPSFVACITLLLGNIEATFTTLTMMEISPPEEDTSTATPTSAALTLVYSNFLLVQTITAGA